MNPRPPASFSRISTYKKCPASYEWQYVLGNRSSDSPGPAAERGTRIHNSIEAFFRAEGDLDPEIEPRMRAYFERIAADDTIQNVMPEMEFALDHNWEPTAFEANDTWVRGFMDNVFFYEDELIIHEYKTGREYDEHDDQKSLYATVALTLFDRYSRVEVVGIYLDQNKMKPTVYERSFLFTYKMKWEREINKLHLPMYPARPGMHCRWCPKSKGNGGPCPVG